MSPEMLQHVRFIPADVASFTTGNRGSETHAELPQAAHDAFLDAVCESSAVALQEQGEITAVHGKAAFAEVLRSNPNPSSNPNPNPNPGGHPATLR